MRRLMIVLGAVFTFLGSETASAFYLTVSDASQVQFMTDPTGKVYFRNFGQFDPVNALGCCYNYWIDTTTIEGKNIFAMFLSDAAQAKPFRILIPDALQPGLIVAAGNY